MYLQSQLEGLESIFFELMPFGVELRRQQVQEYYNKRFQRAREPSASVAENELRRQFNTKANQVRNLVDSAESLGDASDRFNLVRAAATLPAERTRRVNQGVVDFCQQLLKEEKADAQLLGSILKDKEISPSEARMLLGSAMFLLCEELNGASKPMPLKTLLTKLIDFALDSNLLPRRDPFVIEAQCALESLAEEE